MARKVQDRAKAKARRQKQIAIGGAVLLAGILVIQVPKTMKLLNGTPKPPIVTATGGTPAAAAPAATPTAAAAPVTPVAAPAPAVASSALVSAVNATPDVGQLAQFQRFASKDPFAAQVSAGAAASSASDAAPAKAPAAKAPAAPKNPAVVQIIPPAPTAAVIGVNGDLGSVTIGGAFPLAGAVFNRVGSLFQLVSLTAKSAKVAIVGGSYASGAQTLTLKLGHPVTLQNTADGTRYTLLLEPEGTPLPPSVAATVAPAAPSGSVVPSSGSGG